MASQKVRPTALQRFFKISTYNMYAFTLEKPLRLVVRNFSLAILFVFASASRLISVDINSVLLFKGEGSQKEKVF